MVGRSSTSTYVGNAYSILHSFSFSISFFLRNNPTRKASNRDVLETRCFPDGFGAAVSHLVKLTLRYRYIHTCGRNKKTTTVANAGMLMRDIEKLGRCERDVKTYKYPSIDNDFGFLRITLNVENSLLSCCFVLQASTFFHSRTMHFGALHFDPNVKIVQEI